MSWPLSVKTERHPNRLVHHMPCLRYTINDEIKIGEMSRAWWMHKNKQKLIKVFIGEYESKRTL
jgi:hypothetical protein